MPRVVVDPGVMVSAFINPSGTPARLLQAWRDGHYDLLVCPHLIEELTMVLDRPKFADRLNRFAVREFLDALPSAAVMRPDPSDRPGVTRDPKDDYLVSLAIEHNGEMVVSGDKGVLESDGEDIPRMTPAEALRELAQQ